MGKEAERREEVEHRIEPLAPAPWHFSHVAARVAQERTGPPPAGNGKQLCRVIEAVDVIAGFRQKMRVTAVTTWYVENARSQRQAEQIDQTRYLVAIALQGEERAVLEEIVGIECGFPPLACRSQKKTGSR